jgi:shikimate dehydrogenase
VADIVFVGVSTGSSLVHQAMGSWKPLLGLVFGLRGMDISLDASDSTYLRVLDDLRADDSVLGAVITTHKVGVFRAGQRCFTHLDPLARACEEVNAIRRTARTAWLGSRPYLGGGVAYRIWPDTEGDVSCLGADGTAVTLALSPGDDQGSGANCPRCPSPSYRRAARPAHPAPVTSSVDEGPWDALISSAPPGSLIVNATGMGEDRAGSPITAQARFPPRAVI